MAKIRGYSSYRGRGPLWKILAATALAAVILASFGVLVVQRSMEAEIPRPPVPSADESGQEAREPGQDPSAETQPETPPEETVPETPPPEEETPSSPALRAYAVQAAPWNKAVYWDVAGIAQREGCNAVSALLKDEEGWIYFTSDAALSGSTRVNGETNEALAQLTASSTYSIARIACFHDPIVASKESSLERYALKNTGTYLFYDGNSSNWLDPAKEMTRAYLCGLAQDAAELGFDEILLTAVSYPRVGKLDKIAYGDTPIDQNLSAFLGEVRAALQTYGVKLSVEVPKEILLDGGQDVGGMTLEAAAPHVDRIYAAVEPGEIQRCADAVNAVQGGVVRFVPELRTLPDPAPAWYMRIPF